MIKWVWDPLKLICLSHTEWELIKQIFKEKNFELKYSGFIVGQSYKILFLNNLALCDFRISKHTKWMPG